MRFYRIDPHGLFVTADPDHAMIVATRAANCYRAMVAAKQKAHDMQGQLDSQYTCCVNGQQVTPNTAMPGNGLAHCLFGYFASIAETPDCLLAANIGWEGWEVVALQEWWVLHNGSFNLNASGDWAYDTIRDIWQTLRGYGKGSPQDCLPKNCKKI